MKVKAFNAVFPDLKFISSTDMFFQTVRDDYPAFREEGYFLPENKEAVFIYSVEKDKKKHTGVVLCVDIEEYLKGNIKKHENTINFKEQQQLQLILRRKAAVKPILLTYSPVEKIEKWIKRNLKKIKPVLVVDFDNLQQTHKVWMIREPAEIKRIKTHFDKYVSQVYVADGHHRIAATAKLFRQRRDSKKKKKYDVLLSAFLPFDQLEIHNFDRIVTMLDDISPTFFLAKLSAVCDIKPLVRPKSPKRKHEMTLFINNEWYSLKWKPAVLKKYKDDVVIFDVNLLNEKILQDILGIRDIRVSPLVKYIEGPKGLEGLKEKTLKKEKQIAFSLYPVQLEELIKMADRNLVLPPKSTWFEPRLKNGVIVQEF